MYLVESALIKLRVVTRQKRLVSRLGEKRLISVNEDLTTVTVLK